MHRYTKGANRGLVAAASNDEATVKHETRDIERYTNEEDVLTREAKYPIKKLSTAELASIVEESLEDTLRTLFFGTKSSVWYVLYDVIEQVMLDLVQKDVNSKTSQAHVKKGLDSDAAAMGIQSGCQYLVFSRRLFRLLISVKRL